MSNPHPIVKSGLDSLREEKCKSLQGLRVGLLAHPSSVDCHLKHAIDIFLENSVKLVRLFGAEHGILGNAQYMEEVGEIIEPHCGLPVVSLYGKNYDSLHLKASALKGLDVLVVDLQDVGSRYYTFAYTMAFAMRACAQAGLKCLVLDRPNPIGCVQMEGNVVQKAFYSFVGEYGLANRHGLSMGELAHFFKEADGHACDLEVIWMKGYKRQMYFSDTGLPFVLPSPNMPTPDTALVYPGGCLLEGTNLSEGRGTTRPFELLGAPYIKDPYLFAEQIMQADLRGLALRPCYFTPTFDKHAGKQCAGVQVHVTKRAEFLALRTYVAIIHAAKQYGEFAWRTEPYEFVSDRLAIDLLFGSNKPRALIEKGASVDDVMATFEKDATSFARLRQKYLHYKS